MGRVILTVITGFAIAFTFVGLKIYKRFAGDVSAAKTIEITANDQMRFDQQNVVVTLGERVAFTLTNVGQQPKETMGHNLVILKRGVDPQAFGLNVVANGGTADNGYLPSDRSDIMAHTDVLGPGESQTIHCVFQEMGNYHFVCTFPGHVATMHGSILAIEPR